jgi:GAF domain-containing protein
MLARPTVGAIHSVMVTDASERGTTGADTVSSFAAGFVRSARELYESGGVEATLGAVVRLARTTIEGCDFAAVSVLREGLVTTAVDTDPLVAESEAIQFRVGLGPSPTAARQGAPIYIEDLNVDPRWPLFAASAVASGLRSMLTMPLAIDGTTGALSLYASRPRAFGAVDRAKGVVLARLAGGALTLAQAHDEDERKAQNLRYALVGRELIGQAQGILMERKRVTAEQAFDMLCRASQYLNIKLRDVAKALVDTGEIPDAGCHRGAEPPTSGRTSGERA